MEANVHQMSERKYHENETIQEPITNANPTINDIFTSASRMNEPIINTEPSIDHDATSKLLLQRNHLTLNMQSCDDLKNPEASKTFDTKEMDEPSKTVNIMEGLSKGLKSSIDTDGMANIRDDNINTDDKTEEKEDTVIQQITVRK